MFGSPIGETYAEILFVTTVDQQARVSLMDSFKLMEMPMPTHEPLDATPPQELITFVTIKVYVYDFADQGDSIIPGR